MMFLKNCFGSSITTRSICDKHRGSHSGSTMGHSNHIMKDIEHLSNDKWENIWLVGLSLNSRSCVYK